MLKKLAKNILRTVAPKQAAAIEAAHNNKISQRVLDRHGLPAIAESFMQKYGAKVQEGPFAGMAYIEGARGSSFIPKLLGSYECELHEIIQKVVKSRYDVVVDVGSAEGYYAVGLATKLEGEPKVYAFDTDKAAQEMCRELSVKNSVQGRVIIGGYCDTEQLENILQGHSLVVCDCEGYEIKLLDPSVVPSLASAEILVELHDKPQLPITPEIINRFSASHHIQLIDSTPRNPKKYSAVHFLPLEKQEVAVSEFRHGPQQWAYLVPKS